MTANTALAALSPAWGIAIGGWERSMRRAGLTDATRNTRRRAIVRYAAAFPNAWAATPDDVGDWLATPERWPAVTPKLMGSTLRSFYDWGVSVGHVAASPVPRARRVRTPLTPAWGEALDAWLRSEREAGHSPATTAKYAQRIELFATTGAPASPWDVTGVLLVTWFRAQPWQASTAVAARSALRVFYTWATMAHRIALNPADYLSAINTPVNPRPLGTRGPERLPVPDAWMGPLTLYGRHQLARGQARSTVVSRREQLSLIARALHPLTPWEVSADDLLEWLSTRDCSASTRRSSRQALVNFYRWAQSEGHIDTDPTAPLPTVRATLPSPHPAADVTIGTAMAAAAPRERLMLRLGAELGLRCCEIACVHTRDLLERDGGWALVVHGKGSRDRVIPLPGSLSSALRSLPYGWAFPSPTAPTGHLQRRTVTKLLSAALPAGVTAHALRHRFATRAYELERDIFTVQRLLGHASPNTTQAYVATTEATMRSTVERLAASSF